MAIGWPMTETANRVDISQLDQFEAVGQGGSAVVYRASCSETQRQLAVKVFGVPGAEPCYSADRFNREAAVMRELSQLGGFVPIESSGHLSSGRPFLVMPFYAAGSLQDRLRTTGALDWQEGLQIVEQLAQAMEFAHARQIFHRDLKPANVLIDDEGRPAISDFGISQVEREDAPTVSVSISGPVLTPVYSPPEAFADEGADSATQDVYGLAATLWALLAGRAPFTSDHRVSLMTIVGRVLHDPVGDLRPTVPGPVCQLIEASMAKNPADRPQTMADFVVQLRSARQASVELASGPHRLLAEIDALRPVGPGAGSMAERVVGSVALASRRLRRLQGPRAMLGAAAAAAIMASLVGAMSFGSRSVELAKTADSSGPGQNAEGFRASAGADDGSVMPDRSRPSEASAVGGQDDAIEPGEPQKIGTVTGHPLSTNDSSDDVGFEGLTKSDDLMMGDGLGGDGDSVAALDPNDPVRGKNPASGASAADPVSPAPKDPAAASSGTPVADASAPETPLPANPSVAPTPNPAPAPTTPATLPTTTAPTTTTPASSPSTSSSSSPETSPPGSGGPGPGGGGPPGQGPGGHGPPGQGPGGGGPPGQGPGGGGPPGHGPQR